MGWGGLLTFMYLAYIRGCYAAATSLGMGGVGGDINVHVPCVHTWLLRCCYVTGPATSLGMGGVGDINVHVARSNSLRVRDIEFLGRSSRSVVGPCTSPCKDVFMMKPNVEET